MPQINTKITFQFSLNIKLCTALLSTYLSENYYIECLNKMQDAVVKNYCLKQL